MKEKIGSILRAIFVVSIVLTLGMFWFDQINYYLYYYYEDYGEAKCREEDNIALIKVQGEIVTYEDWYGYYEGQSEDIVSSERIVQHIEDASDKDHIKGIIVEIDSYGGLLTASEEIMNALKRTRKPTVAVIRDVGVSGAYLVGTGADSILASEFSSIGGIGVTMSYLDYSEKSKKEGITFQEISSAEFKDAGDPYKELTEKEREKFKEDIMKAHDIFTEEIAENRGMELEDVEELADGSSMMGERAKEKGLIDEIGDVYKAKQKLGEKLNITPEICK